MIIIPEDHREEFIRSCPDVDFGARPAPVDILKVAQRHNEASALLGSLAVFLDGYVQEVQIRIQAQEMAQLQGETGSQYL